jgi:hypothetical protein
MTDYKPKLMRVKIRRNLSDPVRPEAEQLDGREFTMVYAWTQGPDERYPSEKVYVPYSLTHWPSDAPAWIAEGDLEEAPLFLPNTGLFMVSEAKCYTDLEGTVEAKVGDRVAMCKWDGEMSLLQPEPPLRPTLMDDNSLFFALEAKP